MSEDGEKKVNLPKMKVRFVTAIAFNILDCIYIHTADTRVIATN